jgi:hypothetical protein
MPLRNRVTPFGEIVPVGGRGLLMGNRGILHDDQRTIIRDSQVHRWIACRLEFRGRHRTVMRPGSYTELFFLDEAAALAAGHRPCAECRWRDYQAFQAAWRLVHPGEPALADVMDARLHAERRVRAWVKRTAPGELADLPDGTYVALDGRAWLVWSDRLFAWAADRYVDDRPRPTAGTVTVLTPPSLVGVLQAGYRPMVHPSVSGPRLASWPSVHPEGAHA